jgi:hypothetical protein
VPADRLGRGIRLIAKDVMGTGRAGSIGGSRDLLASSTARRGDPDWNAPSCGVVADVIL